MVGFREISDADVANSIEIDRLAWYGLRGDLPSAGTVTARIGVGDLSRKRDATMILGKFWRTVLAQANKLANRFRSADPLAQMQYEYDLAVAQLREGRVGLEQYRALVERVGRQVDARRTHVGSLEAKVKAYLLGSDRETAARYALELQKAGKDLADDEAQLRMHEEAYENSLAKIKHASGQLAAVRDKIARYDAELKTSKAEAEMARLTHELDIDVATDFGQVEQVVQDRIGMNRARARVAADLAGDGVARIKDEQRLESVLAEQALREFEARAGLGYHPSAPAIEDHTRSALPSRSREAAREG